MIAIKDFMKKWTRNSIAKRVCGLSMTLLLLLGSAFQGQTQDPKVYRTKKGRITISTVYEDSAVIAKSDELIVLLDHENAEFTMTLDKSTLKTGHKVLDAFIESGDVEKLRFQGELGLDYIETDQHKPRDFDVEGTLNIFPEQHIIEGEGELVHIFGGQNACVLTMTIRMDPEELGVAKNLPGLGGGLHIEIAQTVLKDQ